MPSAPYRLVDGKAKIQIEDILGTKPGGGWVYQAPGVGNPGAEGAHYYYRSQTAEGSHKTAPVEGRFAITLDIETAGVYGLLLRVSRDTSDPPDARNDIWIQIDGDTTAVMPEGTPPLTEGGDGFVKFKSSPPAGTWSDRQGLLDADARRRQRRPRTWSSARASTPSSSPRARPATTSIRCRWSPAACSRTKRSRSPRRSPPARDDFESLHGASSDDLDLGRVNGNASPVGVRFTGFDIAAGAEIESAYFVFTANAAATALGSLAIQLQGTLGARDFVAGGHLDTRTYLEETVTWDNIGAWEKDKTYRSADISDLIEALVAGGGLEAEDALAFRLTGTGQPLGLFLRRRRGGAGARHQLRRAGLRPCTRHKAKPGPLTLVT